MVNAVGPSTGGIGFGGPPIGGFVTDLQGPNGDAAMRLLAQELNQLFQGDQSKVQDALKQLQQLKPEDLMLLLLLLDPNVQQALKSAFGQGGGGARGGGAPATPRGGGGAPALPRSGGGMPAAPRVPGGTTPPAGTRVQPPPTGTAQPGNTPPVNPADRGRTVGDTTVPRQQTYAPGSPEARALFTEAARLAGLPPEWGNSEALHNILRRESGGQVGRPNYTYGARARDPAQWGSVHEELRNGNITARSSATGLGQLLLSNVDKYYPNGRAGIGDPLQEAAGMLRYIKDRYGTPENAWRLYGTRHEGY